MLAVPPDPLLHLISLLLLLPLLPQLVLLVRSPHPLLRLPRHAPDREKVQRTTGVLVTSRLDSSRS